MLFPNLAQSTQIAIDMNEVAHALVYAALGVVVFTLAFYVMAKTVPFSMRKEIEEDQNTALGVIVGSVIIGLAIVIGAAVHGGTTVINQAPEGSVSAPTLKPVVDAAPADPADASGS